MEIQQLPDLYAALRTLIAQAQARAVRQVNATLVELYWHIGHQLVEHEQGGVARAAYGQSVLCEVAVRLTAEFGKGYEERNLRYTRPFVKHFQFGTHCVPNWAFG